MKRRLLIILIFLLAGAVVNVAVAWGCAGWLDTDGGELTEGRGLPVAHHWAVNRWDKPGVVLVHARRYCSEGPLVDKDFSKLIKAFTSDIFTDFNKDYIEEFDKLEAVEKSLVRKFVGKTAADLMRKNFRNIIDGEF